MDRQYFVQAAPTDRARTSSRTFTTFCGKKPSFHHPHYMQVYAGVKKDIIPEPILLDVEEDIELWNNTFQRAYGDELDSTYPYKYEHPYKDEDKNVYYRFEMESGEEKIKYICQTDVPDIDYMTRRRLLRLLFRGFLDPLLDRIEEFEIYGGNPCS